MVHIYIGERNKQPNYVSVYNAFLTRGKIFSRQCGTVVSAVEGGSSFSEWIYRDKHKREFFEF